MVASATPSHVVIAGGSGFLGISLAEHLINAGMPVVILSRQVPKAVGAWGYVRWEIPRRLQHEGFEFRFPDLRAAQDDLLGA